MGKPFASLERIDHNQPITRKANYEFLHNLQSAILLALREQGRLNTMQHRYAEEKLKQQRRDRAKTILQKGEFNDQNR